MNFTAVAIVGVICWAIVALTRGPKRSSKKDNAQINDLLAEQEQLKAELQNMAERLVVLEKIVTDEKYELNKEFANLKD